VRNPPPANGTATSPKAEGRDSISKRILLSIDKRNIVVLKKTVQEKPVMKVDKDKDSKLG
jgi:hypothetical protein